MHKVWSEILKDQILECDENPTHDKVLELWQIRSQLELKKEENLRTRSLKADVE